MARSRPAPPPAHGSPTFRRRLLVALLGVASWAAPTSAAEPARFAELRGGLALRPLAPESVDPGTGLTLAVGQRIAPFLEGEVSVGALDSTFAGERIALPGQTYVGRPLSSVDVRVLAVPIGLTARLVLPSERVRPYLLAGAGLTVARLLATPESGSPVQRATDAALELHAGFGFVADVTDRLLAGVEARFSRSRVEAFGLALTPPAFQYSAGVGYRF